VQLQGGEESQEKCKQFWRQNLQFPSEASSPERMEKERNRVVHMTLLLNGNSQEKLLKINSSFRARKQKQSHRSCYFLSLQKQLVKMAIEAILFQVYTTKRKGED